MRGPRVSVVIPVHDQAAFLGEALDAFAAQTFTDLEVIVVDDASTDGSGRVAEGRAGVRVIRLDPNRAPARPATPAWPRRRAS